ncbi:MAG: 8-oxoguanine DNA glycosylase [Clostridia bacterium]|nr:8-oxoguanine DNA glycosylase [Clostridia bacterium]
MKNTTVIIKDLKHFDIVKTLESGQCFRWEKKDDRQFVGTAYHRTISIGQIGNDIYIDNTNEHDMKYIWTPYFDLDRDYEKIIRVLSEDDIMKKAIEFSGGIHHLRQQPFETLITFIISSNNNIPRIKKIIKKLSEDHGEGIEYSKDIHYSFPSAEKLAASKKQEIDTCKAGFRCSYIHKTAMMVHELKYDFRQLAVMPYLDARESLKQFAGVGDKVADCVLLFTGMKTESFPVDVWVKRVMEDLYLTKDTSLSEINQFGRDKFKEYAGFANTYLFNYIRNME